MCEPISASTAAYISLGTTVIGTGLQIMGQMQQGAAASKQAAYQAAVARNNSILAERAAQDAIERGKIAADRKKLETRQLLGRQRAVLAGNNVVVDEGSALDITTDTAGIGKLDELTILNNAEREAAGFRAQGMNFSAQAGLYDASGAAARASAITGAVGSAISGAGAVAQKWYGFKKERVI